MARKSAQPAATSQPPKPRRPVRARRGRRVWLVLALAGLLVLGASIYLAFGTQTGTASIAAQNFCATLVAHDYTRGYAQLSDRLRAEGTAAEFAASQRALDQIQGPARTCTFSNPSVRADTATFMLTVSRAGGGTASGTLDLVYEHQQWRVDGYDANVI